jgi:para-aminobenzoate synthetase component 1
VGDAGERNKREAPPFRSGWFALFSYDLGREIERHPARAADDLLFPHMYLACHPVVLAYDYRAGAWWAGCAVEAGQSARDRRKRARRAVELLLAGLPTPKVGSGVNEPISGARVRAVDAAGKLSGSRRPGVAEAAASSKEVAPGVHSNFTREGYEAAVARALEYIAAGDIYQVNLSQRFQAAWRPSAFDLHMALRRESPAPYSVFANLGEGRAVCSVSPELFLRVRGRACVTRPIKGTRPRGRTPAEDRHMREELEASAKDRAELTMIVDLERNDLGRVCEYGSVRVLSAGDLEAHPTVFHRVATVAGVLRRGLGAAALLAATFPGGSVTGAPKIRAMEIIEELEPTRRGPYCGALGWLGDDGDLELNLAIRTALVEEARRRVWYQAGGGIVAESTREREYEETLAKAAGFFRACGGCRLEAVVSR